MKSELATAIIAAIAGVLIAYFVCNIFIGEISPVTFKTVENDVSADLAEPDPEVFNYKALNPTVEIYIGDCTSYDATGVCVEEIDTTEEEPAEEESTEESTNNANNTNNSNNSTRRNTTSEANRENS